MTTLKIPEAPKSIQKGFPLKMVLDKEAVSQLAKNLHHVHASFDKESFIDDALNGIDESHKMGDTQSSTLVYLQSY